MTEFDFLNKFCRVDCHSKCHASWTGLGFHFFCNCQCHKKKQSADENWTDNSSTYKLTSSDVADNQLMCKPNKMSDKRSTEVSAL